MITISRRSMLLGAAALAGVGMLPRFASAQEFQSLDIFIPGAPGGGWDQTGRVMDEVMRNEGLIGNSRITNVGGSGGTIGLPQFINQYSGDPDSIFIAGSVIVGTIISTKTPVDLSTLKPIARLIGEYEALVVPAESPIQSLAELMDALRSDPKSVIWAGGAVGALDHIFASMIAKEAGVGPADLSYVAFSGGGGEAMAALLGGQVSVGISGYGEFAEQITAGNLRLIGISAPERVPGVDAPTLVEQGVNVTISNWRGVFGAPEIDDAAVERLAALIEAMVKSAAWQEQVATRGWSDQYLPAAEFATYLAQDIEATRAVLVELGLA